MWSFILQGYVEVGPGHGRGESSFVAHGHLQVNLLNAGEKREQFHQSFKAGYHIWLAAQALVFVQQRRISLALPCYLDNGMACPTFSEEL